MLNFEVFQLLKYIDSYVSNNETLAIHTYGVHTCYLALGRKDIVSQLQ